MVQKGGGGNPIKIKKHLVLGGDFLTKWGQFQSANIKLYHNVKYPHVGIFKVDNKIADSPNKRNRMLQNTN